MSKKRRNILPRFFRFLGRISVSAGTVLGAGLGMMLIYMATRSVNIGGGIVLVPEDAAGSTGAMIKTSNLIWAGLFIVLAIVGMIFVMNRLNGFVRGTIKKLANFLNWPIFATELVLTLVIWGACMTLLLFLLPVGVIISGGVLVLTEICFILAWLLYKRPKYKL